MKIEWSSKLLVCFALLLVFSCSPLAEGAEEQLAVSATRHRPAEKEGPGSWAVLLRLNNPVFPSNLMESTTVTVNNKDEKFELRVPRERRKAITVGREFAVVPLNPSESSATVTITVKKGLADASGRRLLPKDFTYQFVSAERISVTGLTTFYRSDTEKGVILSVSHPVAENELAAAISIIPAVKPLNVAMETRWRFRLTGDFQFDRPYVLRIAGGPVDNGRGLLQEKEFPFKGPGIKPEIAVRTKRSVVELRSRQLLPLTLSNVTKVRCTLSRVPAYLIPEVAGPLGAGVGMSVLKWEEKLAQIDRLSREAVIGPVFAGPATSDAEAFVAPEAKAHVYGYSLPLSFRKHPDKGGAWIAAFSDPDGAFAGEALRLVQITDLSISYKRAVKSLLVWVTSLHTGQTVPGAEIMLCDSDGHRYFPGKTDKNGLLLIKDGQNVPAISAATSGKTTRAVNLAQVKWAVAATDSDSCGIELDSLRLKPFSVTQTEKPTDRRDALTGQVFTERGIYRPGETVHFKFVARTYQDNRIVAPAGEKFHVEILNPQDDVSYSQDLTLGDFGTCWDSLHVKSFFPVGAYTIKVSTIDGKKETLTDTKQRRPRRPGRVRNTTDATVEAKKETFSHTFMVQEFKRPRHFVTLSVKREQREDTAYVGLKRDEEFLAVEVAGQYYTGGPMKHGKVRWKATLVPVTNTVKNLDGYLFGSEDDKTLFLESGESMLDSAGKLRLAIPLDPRLLTGIYGVEVSATVLDIDGEPATDVMTFNPKPKFLVGVSKHPKQVQTGYAAPLKVIVVDPDGKKVGAGKIEATILQKRYFYSQKRDGEGNINYLWEEGWMKTLTTQQTLVNGEATFQLDLVDSGDYLVSATYEEGTKRYTSQTLFTVGWQEYDQWVRNQEERTALTGSEILLSMSRTSYSVGEQVQIEFNTPRPVKKCLVTMETGDILDYEVIDLKGTAGSYRFKVKDEYQPNVYVGVTAAAGREGFPVYAVQPDSEIPIVYYGYANVSVLSEKQKLKLEIDPGVADLKGRPAENKTLAFKVTDQRGKGVVAEMAVCVVDEAVLALTRFKTPDLSSLTKFDLPLAVFTGDLRMDLVSQDLFRMFTTKPLTGGDEGLGAVSVSLRKDFRPVAYFNPSVKSDESGTAKVEFKLPDSTTAYRVYAVVCDKSAGFVSGQRNMVVTKEFFIEPSLPRFLIPGDRVVFPVVLNNKTKEKGKFALKVTSSADLKVRLLETAGSLEPWSRTAVKAEADVLSGMDKAVIRFQGAFTGDAGRYDDAMEETFPLLSRYLPAHRVTLGSFMEEPAELTAELPPALKTLSPQDFNPADFKAYLSLSNTNWAKIAPGLKYLLNYPYGCIEQTSSGVIPLAGIRGLVKTGVFPGITVEEVDRFITSGVDRLLSMQVQSGGFAYWKGELNPSWWATMYATFALESARQAGVEVPEDRMQKALKFLREGILGTDEDRHHGQAWTRDLAVLNLAAGKALTTQELAKFFENYDGAGEESKALLLLAAKKIQYLPAAKLTQLVRQLAPRLDPKRTSYHNSTFREHAVCLMAAMEIGGAPQKTDQWAGVLVRGLKPQGCWVSTADTGWCLLALSMYYRAKDVGKPAPARVRVQCAGEQATEVTVTDATAYVELDPRKLLDMPKIKLESDKKQLVNYTLSLTYPDITTDPAKLSMGFTLRKKMENLNGKDEIRVGDVVRVTLEMGLQDPDKKYEGQKFEYLALEDPVPAGLVPINPELKTEGADRGESEEAREDTYSNGFFNFTPNHQEFRDDEVRVFKNQAWTDSYRYSYLARAVAEGDFWMRGSRITLMYDPDLFGRTAGKKVTILPAGK